MICQTFCLLKTILKTQRFNRHFARVKQFRQCIQQPQRWMQHWQFHQTIVSASDRPKSNAIARVCLFFLRLHPGSWNYSNNWNYTFSTLFLNFSINGQDYTDCSCEKNFTNYSKTAMKRVSHKFSIDKDVDFVTSWKIEVYEWKKRQSP